MVKWEYKTINIPDTENLDITSFLNTYGDEGWELVTVAPNGRVFLFKRSIETKQNIKNIKEKNG